MDYTGSPPQTQIPQRPQPGPYVASYPPEELKTEFQRKYPPDPFGAEMEASARVWKVFKDEATNHDKTLLAGWNKTLDILLIFAGLFSAVATAFVIESYKLLQPDYEEYIATALFVAFSARNASGALPDSTLNLRNPAEFAPLRSSRWLNGIWFTSLVLSLLVAFLCILLKQWLEEYNGRISAPFPSVRQWARRRTFYFDGLINWAVPVLIALLPLLLHAALFLFLAGLGVFLLPLDSVNSVWLVTLTSSLAVFYAVSTVLPFIRRDCPSSTAVVRLLRTPVRIQGLRILMWISSLAASPSADAPLHDDDGDDAGNERLSPLWRYVREKLASTYAFSRHAAAIAISPFTLLVPPRLRSRMIEIYWRLHYQFAATGSSVANPSLRGREVSDREQEQLEARALRWIITSRSTADVVVVAFQAIGALPPWSPIIKSLLDIDDLAGLLSRSLDAVYGTDTCSPADISRSVRSATCLFPPQTAWRIVGNAAGDWWDIVNASPHYDWPFLIDMDSVRFRTGVLPRLTARLAQCLPKSAPFDPDCRPHFLLSTASQALHSFATPLSLWFHLSRLIPLRNILPRDFIAMTMTLLRHRGLDSCPLKMSHRDRDCSIQCSYELLSDIINARESLGLQESDAHIGLTMLLNFSRRRAAVLREIWIPVERSHLLELLASEFFASHTMPFFGSSLETLVESLVDAAKCLQRPRGLPLWTSQWAHAVHSIVCRASVLGDPDVLGESISWQIPWLVLAIYDVDRPYAHVRTLPSDDMAHLPLFILQGGITSTWEMLVSLPQHRSQGVCLNRLGNHLATCLCIAARRGIDVSVEFETFVASSHIMRRLHELQEIGDISDESMGEFVTLVQHCNEIRPGWLLEVVPKVLGTHPPEYDASLQAKIDHINGLAVKLRRCHLCPDRTFRTALYRRLTLAIGGGGGGGGSQIAFEEDRAKWVGALPSRNDYDRGADVL